MKAPRRLPGCVKGGVPLPSGRGEKALKKKELFWGKTTKKKKKKKKRLDLRAFKRVSLRTSSKKNWTLSTRGGKL